MNLVNDYRDARRSESVSRLRRVIALRAMLASGKSQREVAGLVGLSQPAVSQQLRFAPDLQQFDPVTVLEAAAPVLKTLAAERGYTRLAVFGSVARGQARPDSDIDLLVKATAGTSSFDLVKFQLLPEKILDRAVDLVEYGGLKSGLDDDIKREAVLL
jgi:predicted nucleotidyltransferase